jgi:hypothetical protein
VDISRPKPTYQISIVRLQCSACGAEANASCNCGKPYVPAKQRAADAVAAHPEKSNRAIAAEVGVDEKTVRQARDSTADYSAVEERTGLDGKKRKLPSYIPPHQDEPNQDADLIDQIENLFMQLTRQGQARCGVRLRQIIMGDA